MGIVICLDSGPMPRVRGIRRTRWTCPANFGNVRRRAVVKFNQMSGEAQNNFAYSAMLNDIAIEYPSTLILGYSTEITLDHGSTAVSQAGDLSADK